MSLSIHTAFSKSGTTQTVNMHDLRSVKSGRGSMGHAWVTFADDCGHTVGMHVDERLADMLTEAFAEYENEMSSQEGPTFDDALAGKCDAEARVAAARALK